MNADRKGQKMKSSRLIAIAFILLSLIGFTFYYVNSEKAGLYAEVNDEHYVLTYIEEPSMHEYTRLEIAILPSGDFVSKKYMVTGEIETIKGFYSKKDIENFMKYAVRKNITRMTDDMNALRLNDGSNIFFGFKFEQDEYLVGGYGADFINVDFSSIYQRFNELERTVTKEYTRTYIDIDANGTPESLSIVLLEGEEIDSRRSKGVFALEIYDENNVTVDQIPISSGAEIILPKSISINFEDYNGDGLLDCAIGHINPDNPRELIYNLYTVSVKKGTLTGLKELKIASDNSTVKSYFEEFTEYSRVFPKRGQDSFVTYTRKGDMYIYKAYKWYDTEFAIYEYMKSSVLLDDSARDNIDRTFSTITSYVEDKMDYRTESLIYRSHRSSYNWFLEHLEDVKIYLFHLDPNEPHSYNLKHYLSKRVHQRESLNAKFYEFFDVDNIEEYSLEEIKNLGPIPGLDDCTFEEHSWNVEGLTYKLLAGRCHLNNFVILFSEEGRYLDSYIWLNKVDETAKLELRNVQDFMTISPVQLNYGAGIFIVGAVWFEVYDDKLITVLESPILGYEYPGYTSGYSREYSLVSENYDPSTGDYHATYNVGISLIDSREWIGLEKTITHTWDENNMVFKPNSYGDYYFVATHQLFSEGIEDEILSVNINKTRQIVNRSILKNAVDDLEILTEFLMACEKGPERDSLLNKIHYWYSQKPDVRDRDEFIKRISNKLTKN